MITIKLYGTTKSPKTRERLVAMVTMREKEVVVAVGFVWIAS